MIVQSLVQALLEQFPPQDAEAWDRPGLLVGDPHAQVRGVVCALDPLPQALLYARKHSANVLLTHHPAFLSPPCAFTPRAGDSSLSGSVVWQAIKEDVALVALHTNLDRSERALKFFARLLDLPYLGRATAQGYGALLDAKGLSADELAHILVQKFNAKPQVWGDGSTPIDRCAYLSGSLGDLGPEAVRAGAQCLIGGEESYHRILEILHKSSNKKGKNVVILIGHDASELPYGLLLQQVVQAVVNPALVQRFPETAHWHLLST